MDDPLSITATHSANLQDLLVSTYSPLNWLLTLDNRLGASGGAVLHNLQLYSTAQDCYHSEYCIAQRSLMALPDANRVEESIILVTRYHKAEHYCVLTKMVDFTLLCTYGAAEDQVTTPKEIFKYQSPQIDSLEGQLTCPP